MSLAELKGDLVILVCAISAGIHGALVRSHFDETVGAGLGFAVATVVLGALAVWLTLRPTSRKALQTAVVSLVGLLATYALATTTGVPVLHPDPEPIDVLALATKAIETVGLLTATSLLLHRVAVPHPHPKGTLT